MSLPGSPSGTAVVSRGALLRFRIMAFVTGLVLVCGTVTLILKYATSVGHLEPWSGYLWVAHGYLYLVYVITVLILGFKDRWHLARIGLVVLAGTIPTMSFVAEHFVTRHVRARHPELVPSSHRTRSQVGPSAPVR